MCTVHEDGRWKHEKTKRDVENNFRRKYENRNHKESVHRTRTEQWDKTESKERNDTLCEDKLSNWNDFLLSVTPPEIDWDKINKEYVSLTL